jgi:hypothetical protein
MSLADQSKTFPPTAIADGKKRAIAYSIDTLTPGFYLWLGNFSIRLFGTEPDDTPYRYPGTVNSKYGVALVFPGYHIFTTYKDCYDPR